MNAFPASKPAIDYIITMQEVCAMIGLSRHTVYRMVDLGQFPTPGKLGTRRIGWRTSDVNAWLTSRFGEKPACAGVVAGASVEKSVGKPVRY